MPETTTATIVCTGCGRKDFKGTFGLKIHQTAPKADAKCRLAGAPAGSLPCDEPVAGSHNDHAANDQFCEDLNGLAHGTLGGATVTEWDPYVEFRKVGAVAEFDTKYLSAAKAKALAGQPVKVFKVNPKTIVVQTQDGQNVTTDPWLLTPTDKPFVLNTAKPVRAMDVVTVRGIRLSGGEKAEEGLWIAMNTPSLDGKVRIARLGNSGRYFNIPVKFCTVVDAALVLA